MENLYIYVDVSIATSKIRVFIPSYDMSLIFTTHLYFKGKFFIMHIKYKGIFVEEAISLCKGFPTNKYHCTR